MSSRRSRREFLKSTAVTGLGVWVAGGRASGVAKSPSAKLDVGIIGAGGRGGSNLSAVAELANIVALCDVDQRRAGKAFETYPSAKRYTDFRKMLDNEKLDAVVVSTPDHTHAIAAITAMRLGKHVYCEKPLAHSVHEARVMAKTAAQYQVVTQMGNQGHAGNGVRSVVEAVRAGFLGPIREVITWSNKIYAPGNRPTERPPVPVTLDWDRWLGPAPERPYHPAYVPFDWRGWWDFGSGNFGDMACHIMDAAYWGLNLRYPTTIEAEGPSVHPESAPRWLIVRYGFPARGDQPPVKLTWYNGEKSPPMPDIEGMPLPKQGSLLIGDEGKLLFPHHTDTYHLFPRQKFADFKRPEPTLPRPKSHHAEWIEACRSGGRARSDFDYGGRLTETILAGVVAYRLGKKLEWDGAGMRATNCAEASRLIRPRLRSGGSI